MPGIPSSQFGLVSRSLPAATTDGNEREQRYGRYGDTYVQAVVPKLHAVADEGSYFVANNSGTGVATTATPTAFSDTAPMFTILNTDTAQNSNFKRIHLDWMRVTQTAAGTAGTDLRFRVVLDYTTPSAGTVYTPLNMNTDVPRGNSVAVPRLFPTGVTQSGNSRVVIGSLIAIPTQTAPLTAFDEVMLTFGGVDAFYPVYNSAASTNVIKVGYALPPIVVGPGACMMLEFLITAQSAASSWTVECGWWER